MMILLPPSETKRPGGVAEPLSLASLAFAKLTPVRMNVLDALVTLSSSPDAAARVLKLSARQRSEIVVNADVYVSPTMPAIDRYTGVLYDALGTHDLDDSARRWLGDNVVIHTAPLGLVRALDPIPAYRLGAAASLPGIASLRKTWADPVSDALVAAAPPFILDLRSQAYVALGPTPLTTPSVYVRVVVTSDDGAVRALNHFNKHAKGAFVRALAKAQPALDSLDTLLNWALGAGFDVRECGDGSWDLAVS
ncbi:hypothetical protein FHX49_001560 [Microbacterium endophyticum]|uniref:Peroxide stress protein YaaA n=1 Tax=Microbacterium endophyticum TaxID=1526412 RepID=A0A7W4V358_9MICO|nr:peroxide stress protein YaaA [Microbacterium endophyticum]MBB2975990.1 hypothetical protein [Microbacterium endophyticum]NIK35091.1 hypothetical protein [Microbacterium endophyticum]